MSNSIVCGRMKEGKTTLALYLAFCHSNGVIGWDPRGMMDGFKVYNGEDLKKAIESKKWKATDKNGNTYIQPICYVPEGNLQEDFSAFCSVVFPPRFSLRRFACIIDEAAQLQKSNSINEELDRIVRQHPRDVLLIQTTHSLQDYHRASKDLMNNLYIFQMQGRSLEAVINYCDGSDELRETIATLPEHHCVHITMERHSGPEFEVFDEPEAWFMELDPEAQALQSSEEANKENPLGPPVKPSSENNYKGWVH